MEMTTATQEFLTKLSNPTETDLLPIRERIASLQREGMSIADVESTARGLYEFTLLGWTLDQTIEKLRQCYAHTASLREEWGKGS